MLSRGDLIRVSEPAQEPLGHPDAGAAVEPIAEHAVE